MLQTTYYDPFRVFNRPLATAARQVDKGWSPAVDIIESEAEYRLIFDLPGVDADKIAVAEEKGVLSISGEREALAANDGEVINRHERRNGEFKREFTLPEDANTATIRAESRNGVLTLVIERKKPEETRTRIPVRAA